MRKKYLYPVLGLALSLVILAGMLAGCGDVEGEQDTNQSPVVKFVTVPLDSSEFSYAPTVYWAGSDPDGFVEYYSYADITDSAAIQDPVGFYDQVPDEAWTDLIATEAQIYLLTEQGELTEHVLYVRCFDNEGAVNEDVVFRTFYRTNQAPYIPRVGVMGASDDELATDVYISDTLYSGTKETSIWSGIQFQWRSSDPDDQALYTIPLEYKTILVKAPGDTIAESEWTEDQDIQIVNLETGFYTLYVWCRDDAFEESPAAGRVEFNIIRPTFEHDILVIVEAPDGNGLRSFPKTDSLKNYYNTLFTDIAPEVWVDESDSTDLGHLLSDGTIRFWQVDDLTNYMDAVVPHALIHQYKMVIVASDQVVTSALNQNYAAYRNRVLVDYLRVGGRLWYMGRSLLHKIPNDNPADRDDLGDYDTILMEDFFGADAIVHGPLTMSGSSYALAEFIGTIPALQTFPELDFVDTMKYQNYITFEGNIYRDSLNYGESGAGMIVRYSESITTQYFNSFTSTYIGVVNDENSTVLRDDDASEQLPNQTSCFIQTDHDNVYPDSVTKVENITLRDAGYSNWQGEVVGVNGDLIYVSYSPDQDWLPGDSLAVSYKYNPLSDYHLAPCEIRNEISEVSDLVFTELRSRAALTSFSYYFVDYDGTKSAFIQMLSWFLAE